MKRSDIQATREKVAYYMVKGTPEALIAELIGVHRGTVARDMAYIRNGAKNWLDDLAKDSFIYECRMSLEKIKDHEFELQKLGSEADNVTQNV